MASIVSRATSARCAVSLTPSKRPAGSSTRVIDALSSRKDQIALSGRPSQPQRALEMTPRARPRGRGPRDAPSTSRSRAARTRLARLGIGSPPGSRMVHRRREPAPVVLPVSRLYRLEGETLPVAQPDLPQLVKRHRLEAEARPARRGRVARAAKRARVEAVERRRGEPGGQGRRLRAPARRQGRVERSWKRRFRVPGGLAVPHQPAAPWLALLSRHAIPEYAEAAQRRLPSEVRHDAEDRRTRRLAGQREADRLRQVDQLHATAHRRAADTRPRARVSVQGSSAASRAVSRSRRGPRAGVASLPSAVEIVAPTGSSK